MKYLFFDTETTGLPEKKTKWDEDFNTFPHLVSIAWMLYEDKEPLYNKYYIIKPDGYTIPQESIDIHKITNEDAQKDGSNIIPVLNELLKIEVDFIIGHNIYFDTSIIKANILRYGLDIDKGIELFHKDRRIDTMYKANGFVGARKENGSGKFPSLQELYMKLFDKKFEGEHHASRDTMAVAECFYELKALDIIQ